MSKLYTIFKTFRPRQWLKNVALFAPIIFTGQLFDRNLFVISVQAFGVFCAVSSANYLLNDVFDRENDRKHPFKKNRAIASGQFPVIYAIFCALILFVIGLVAAFSINTSFFFMTLLYSVLAFSYTVALKHLAVIDILTIALGYFLRVYAGEAATGYHLSVWLSLAVFSLSLFLAIGKRRSELTLLQNYSRATPTDTRKVLGHYSEKLLDTYTAMFANSTWITYAYYSFLERPAESRWMYKNFLLETFPPDRKWLMVTIPFVLFGIMRYMQLIYEGKGESPEKILTSDIPLLATIITWGIIAIMVIYLIGG